MSERAQSLLRGRHAFVTAIKHQGRHSARSKLLVNLCSGTLAVALLVCLGIAALAFPWLVYSHDLLGDGGDYITVPATIHPVKWSKVVSNQNSKKKKVTYYIHATVQPHFEELMHPGMHQHEVHQAGAKTEADKPPPAVTPPGQSCPFFVPAVMCRAFEDITAPAQPADAEGSVTLRLSFADYTAGQLALAKVRAATSVLQDRDTGTLFLLRDAPIEVYLAIAVPLAVAAVILACSAGSQRVQLWNAAEARPLPPPVRVWVEDVKRYMWQLQPAATQLLPQEYSGRAVQLLGSGCLLVNAALLLDSMRVNAMCSAADDCAVPVADIVGRGILGLLQGATVLVPLAAYISGARAAAVGSAVARVQLCTDEMYVMSRLQNVAWPAGSTRRVHVRQRVQPKAGGGQLSITGGRLRLQRWRVHKAQKNIKHSMEFDEEVPLPELRNASAACGATLSTCAEVTVPDDAVLSSMPGSGLPFNTWYLAYELDIQGVGKDSLLIPLHVVAPMEERHP